WGGGARSRACARAWEGAPVPVPRAGPSGITVLRGWGGASPVRTRARGGGGSCSPPLEPSAPGPRVQVGSGGVGLLARTYARAREGGNVLWRRSPSPPDGRVRARRWGYDRIGARVGSHQAWVSVRWRPVGQRRRGTVGGR